jgi:hypothetical protein
MQKKNYTKVWIWECWDCGAGSNTVFTSAALCRQSMKRHVRKYKHCEAKMRSFRMLQDFGFGWGNGCVTADDVPQRLVEVVESIPDDVTRF